MTPTGPQAAKRKKPKRSMEYMRGYQAGYLRAQKTCATGGWKGSMAAYNKPSNAPAPLPPICRCICGHESPAGDKCPKCGSHKVTAMLDPVTREVIEYAR